MNYVQILKHDRIHSLKKKKKKSILPRLYVEKCIINFNQVLFNSLTFKLGLTLSKVNKYNIVAILITRFNNIFSIQNTIAINTPPFLYITHKPMHVPIDILRFTIGLFSRALRDTYAQDTAVVRARTLPALGSSPLCCRDKHVHTQNIITGRTT